MAVSTCSGFTANSSHSCFVHSSQQCGDNYLLLVLLDVGQLKNGTAARFVQIFQGDMFVIGKDRIGPVKSRVEPPQQSFDRARVAGFALVGPFILLRFYRVSKVLVSPQ